VGRRFEPVWAHTCCSLKFCLFRIQSGCRCSLILDLAFSVVLLLLGTLVGFGWCLSIFRDRPLMFVWIFSQLFGIATFIVFSSWLVFLEISINYLIPIVFLVGVIGWILGLKNRVLSINLPRFHINPLLWPVTSGAVIFSYLCNRSFFESQFSYRVGPDFFGWSTSSIYFCKNENLTPLTQRISNFLDGTPFRDSLLTPVPNGGKSLWQISSFTDQINAEFLLQANRTGIQSFLGGICQAVDGKFFSHLFLGLAIWAIAISIAITFMFAQRLNGNWKLVSIYSVFGALNFSVLSVVLEGGFGQLILTPYFLMFVSILVFDETYSREFKISALIFFTIAFASYIDVLLILAPIILIFTSLNFGLSAKRLIFDLKNYALVVTMAGFAGFPGVLNAGNTLIERLQRSTYGGWDQGNFPLPANVFGLVPWLPRGLYEKVGISFPILAISIIFSILIVTRIFSLQNKVLTDFFSALLLTYFILFIFTYLVGSSEINNYRIWKFGAYLGILLPYLLLSGTKKGFNHNFMNIPVFASKLNRSIPILVVLSALYWSTDWVSTSKLTLNSTDQSLVSKYSKNYDLQIVNLPAAMFTMYGDIKYGAAIRNFGVKTDKTFPDSSTLIVIPSGSDCEGSICQHLPPEMLKGKSIEVIARGHKVDFIKLMPKN